MSCEDYRMLVSAKKTAMMAGAFVLACCLLFTSCGILGGSPDEGGGGGLFTDSSPTKELDLDTVASMPAVPIANEPVASGGHVESTEMGAIDYSNASDGYVMAKYTGQPTSDPTDVKFVVLAPGMDSLEDAYRYNIAQDGEYYAFPLSEGNGSYELQLFKRTSGNSYATLMSVTVDAEISDPLKPFLIPNQKIRYEPNSLSVKLANELTKDETGVVKKTESVYNYVIKNIVYDKEKAAGIDSNPAYIPDPDETLRTKKGICYDYAVLTAAMLRSQDIPTKVIFGYAAVSPGSPPVYHSWISVYSDETGWIDKIIEFKVDIWTRMDPTFAAGANDKTMAEFIGDGSNYTDGFFY